MVSQAICGGAVGKEEADVMGAGTWLRNGMGLSVELSTSCCYLNPIPLPLIRSWMYHCLPPHNSWGDIVVQCIGSGYELWLLSLFCFAFQQCPYVAYRLEYCFVELKGVTQFLSQTSVLLLQQKMGSFWGGLTNLCHSNASNLHLIPLSRVVLLVELMCFLAGFFFLASLSNLDV